MKRLSFTLYKNRFLLLCTIVLSFFNPFGYTQQFTISPDKKNLTEKDFSRYTEMYSNFNLNQSVDSNLTLLSQLGIGPCYDAVPRDNYLFVGNGALFQILDVSEPTNPVLVGEVLTEVGNIFDIEIYGDYAFFVYPFTVVDISDLSNPVIVNTQPFGIYNVFISGHYAFVDYFAGVKILDIQNPEEPQVMSTISTDEVLGIAIKEEYLYISNLYGIDVYNIINISNPDFVTSYTRISGNLIVSNNYLFNSRIGGLEIFDISNPANLIYLNGIATNKRSSDIFCLNDLIFVSHGHYGDGLSIIDVQDPLNIPEPVYIESENSILGYVSCNIKNNTAFIASGIGVDIYDIQNIDSLVYISSYLTSFGTDKMKIFNTKLYFTNYAGGLKIVDFSDPLNLNIIGEYQNKLRIKDFDISNNFAYLLTPYSVEILNIENPFNIIKVNEIMFPDTLEEAFASSILIKDSILILSLPENYISFINIEDPFNPITIDSILSGENVHDLAMSENYLFSAEGFDGLKVYKLNPLSLVTLIDSVVFSTLTENDYLYTHMTGLSIFDIINLENPSFTSHTFTPGSRSRVEISKSSDFISFAYNQNLEIIDVSDVDNPFIAAFSREDDYSSVASTNNIIFAGNGLRGIKVFRNDLITSVNNDNTETVVTDIHLFQNFPNPFNSTTNIKYFLPEGDYIKIKLYDILGREIKVLDEGLRASGYHDIKLNTKDFSSGVYFYTLITNQGNNLSKKLVLLK